MNISELKNRLDPIEKTFGDIEVIVKDADTDWIFRISNCDLSVCGEGNRKYVEIGPSYGSEIDSTEIKSNKGEL